MVAFETVFLGMVAYVGCGIVAQLLAEEAQGLCKVGGSTTELIGGEADVAFAVEMTSLSKRLCKLFLLSSFKKQFL